MLFSFISLAAVALLPKVFAQNEFINPVAYNASTTGFPEWSFGSKQSISWSTNFSTISLVLWQDFGLPDGTSYYDLVLDSVPYQTSLAYTVNTEIPLDPNNVFYFRLYSGNSSSPIYIESHLFEIVQSPSGSTVYSTVTATATATLAPTTVTAQVVATGVPETSGGPAGTAAPRPASASSGCLTLVNKVWLGVGVGVGIGVGLLLL